MSELKEYLKRSGVQYLATTGLDGKPKVRPFQCMIEQNGKLFYCTSNRKQVFKEMQNQPYVEICALGPDHSWMRMKGKVIFSHDKSVKAAILGKSSMIKSVFRNPDNPVFEIFYLDDGEAVITDETGNQAKPVSF